MLTYLKKSFKYGKVNWRILLIKGTLLFFGLFIMALGISLYLPTGIGLSDVDFTVYTFIYVWRGEIMPSTDIGPYYSTVLMFFFISVSLLTLIFGSISAGIQYKKWKDKRAWNSVIIFLITDIIIIFTFPQIVNFFLLPWGEGGVVGFLYILSDWFESLSGEPNTPLTVQNAGIRGWMFVLAFIIFCLGVSLWAKSTWAPGPYNSVCAAFMKMTNLNYQTSRILCNVIIITPGAIAIWFLSSGDRTPAQAFFDNFGIATMAFVFISGPIINFIIKYLNKWINYEKLLRY